MTLELFYDLYSHLSRTSNKFDRQYSRALRRFKRLEDKLVIRTKRTAAVPEPPTLVVERKTEDVGIQTTPPSVPAAEENQEPEPQQPRHVVARR